MIKKICVINCVTWLRTPISEWVNDEIEVTLVSSYQIDEGLKKKFSHFIHLENYFDDTTLENTIIKLHQKEKFDRLIVFSEVDILRVAKLRELLGIEGQKYFSALLYRDKFAMKQYAQLKGLHVPKFGVFCGQEELEKSVSEIGFPILIKPLQEAGSEGVVTFMNRKEYDNYIKRGFLDKKTKYDVESFISGEMYHVDGVIESGIIKFVSVSKYWNSLGKSTTLMDEMLDVTTTFADFTLSSSEEYFQVLKNEINKFVSNSQFNNGTIHGEFIISENNVPYFIEVASRTGGLMIANTIREKYGFYMNEASFKVQIGENLKYSLKEKNENFGFLTIFPQNKRLIKFDEDNIVSNPEVLKFFPEYQLGKKYITSEYMNHIGVIMFKGTTQEDMKQKINHITKLVDSNIQWQ